MRTRSSPGMVRRNSSCTAGGSEVDSAVHVHLGRVEALRLQKHLVARCLGELHDLVLDRRAVPGAAPADRPAIQRGLLQVRDDDVPQSLAGPGQIAGKLSGWTARVWKENQNGLGSPSWRSRRSRSTDRPSIRGGVPVLNRSTVSPSCFKSLRDLYCRSLAGSPGRHLGVQSHMDPAAQEGPGGQNDGLSARNAVHPSSRHRYDTAGHQPARTTVP